MNLTSQESINIWSIFKINWHENIRGQLDNTSLGISNIKPVIRNISSNFSDKPYQVIK